MGTDPRQSCTLPRALPTSLHVRAALRCLSRPPSLVAISLLLLNDLLLKRVWPSGLTGKLSDFAGLYFAPFLFLLALFVPIWWGQRALRSRRGGAATLPERLATVLAAGVFLATGAFFGALKVPLTAAAALRLLETLLGRQTVVVVDPTDLAALLVLPVAYAAWRRSLRAARATDWAAGKSGSRWRRVGQVAVLFVSSLAVMATSPARIPCTHLTGLAADPLTPNRVYASRVDFADCPVYDRLPDSPKRELFVSQDAGGTWREAGEGGERLLPSPLEPGILYLVNYDGLVRLDTKSGARTALEPPLGPDGADPQRYGLGLPAVAPPWQPGELYVSTPAQLLRSRDGGANWTALALPLTPERQVTAFAAAPSQAGLLYVFADGQFLRSEDRGDNWRQVSEWGWSPNLLQVSPADPALLLAATDKRILLSEDGGMAWREVAWLSSGGTRVYAIDFDPQDARNVYAATGGGVLASSDGGRSWRNVLEGGVRDVAITAGPSAHILAPRRYSRQTSRLFNIWQETEGVFRCRPGQETWEQVDRAQRLTKTPVPSRTPTKAETKTTFGCCQ